MESLKYCISKRATVSLYVVNMLNQTRMWAFPEQEL